MNQTTDNHSLTELQSRLLEMLKWYHAFCRKHDLQYYALGGTMLGAARHQGFIPWDDDIDVGMPRADYDRFLSLMKEEDTGCFRAESPDDGRRDFIYGYAKLYDTRTTLIEKARRNVKRGIYMDIFPLDGAGQSEEDARTVFDPVFRKYQMVVAKTCALSGRRSWYKNAAVIAARMIPDCVVSPAKLVAEIQTLCRTYDFHQSAYVGNFLGNWGFRETMPRACMGTPALYPFEDARIYGAEDADAYLARLYGDWRQLPPEEKRVTHHDCVAMNLHRSYLDD